LYPQHRTVNNELNKNYYENSLPVNSDVKRGQNLEAEAEAKNNYEKSTK